MMAALQGKKSTTTGGVMQRGSRIAIVLGTTCALAFAGCASVGTIHQPEAFGSNKTYAVVTVMANEKVGCVDFGGNPCNGGVFGLVNMATRTNAYSEDASEVLENTYPAALRALRSSTSLKLAPDVKNLKVYRSAAEDAQPKGMMSLSHTVAKGYKYFTDENLARMARELKVDGVITVTISYSAARSGVTVAGVGGKHKAQANVMVRAVNQEGKNVWFDYAQGQSDEGTSTGTGAVDFPKLRPLFVEATDRAAKKLMENLEAKARKM